MVNFDDWYKDYSSLLKEDEWKKRRLEIIKRDFYKCVDCGSIDVLHHVHHQYYIKDSLPWQVPDSCLVTLCKKCHDKRHNEEEIPWYDLVDGKLAIIIPSCDRCGGRGDIQEYKHILGGMCFKCNGKGYTHNGIFIITHERVMKK